jgi:peroxiredoxin (alkyl hydroperoxide reductase subunit C)
MGLRVGTHVPSLEFEAYVPPEAEPWCTSLAELRGSWVVLVFYPRKAVSELSLLARLYPQLESENTIVLAASPDSLEASTDTNSLAGVFYPVIADTAHELGEAFGVLAGDGALRHGTFVIDPESVVRYVAVTDQDCGHGLDEALRVLQALRAARSAAPSGSRPA